MNKLNIAILGSRGIPNNYGGFEQIAGFLARGLVEKGHLVTVYNSILHPYKENLWNGVRIIHIYEPSWLGTAGQFVYDLNCILNSKKHGFDILLMLGYTSSSIWGSFYDKRARVIINMDGLEWKRSKYPEIVKKFLRLAEKLAIKYATAHIADSPVIKQYLDKKYSISCSYIPYGASINGKMDHSIFISLGLAIKGYFLLVARIEPENNIEIILEGFHNSFSDKKIVVVGDTRNLFGKKMLKKYSHDKRILFPGSIYDRDKLLSLVANCSLYFHGHSVGGTNPSLLEAMAAKALIAAHGNPFNKTILQGDCLYFNDAEGVRVILERQLAEEKTLEMIRNNYLKILEEYNWENVIDKYEALFMSVAG